MVIYLHLPGFPEGKKITSWEDTIECLVEAAHEAAFSQEDIAAVSSERHGVSIRHTSSGWMTRSEEVAQEALRQGFWVEKDDLYDGWEIHFSWPKDPDNPPNNKAIHKDRQV